MQNRSLGAEAKLSGHFEFCNLPFDKPVLSKPAASFDTLRTNGWFVEGLMVVSKVEPQFAFCIGAFYGV
jgi:hypothetical protein